MNALSRTSNRLTYTLIPFAMNVVVFKTLRSLKGKHKATIRRPEGNQNETIRKPCSKYAETTKPPYGHLLDRPVPGVALPH